MNLHRKREREKKFLKRNIFKRKKRKRKKERERRLLNESLFITAPERFSIFENFEDEINFLRMENAYLKKFCSMLKKGLKNKEPKINCTK